MLGLSAGDVAVSVLLAMLSGQQPGDQPTGLN